MIIARFAVRHGEEIIIHRQSRVASQPEKEIYDAEETHR